MGDQSQNLELQVAVNNSLMRRTESDGHIPLLLIDISSMLIAFPPLWIDILPMWINIAPLRIGIQVLRLLLPEEWPDLRNCLNFVFVFR